MDRRKIIEAKACMRKYVSA